MWKGFPVEHGFKNLLCFKHKSSSEVIKNVYVHHTHSHWRFSPRSLILTTCVAFFGQFWHIALWEVTFIMYRLAFNYRFVSVACAAEWVSVLEIPPLLCSTFDCLFMMCPDVPVGRETNAASWRTDYAWSQGWMVLLLMCRVIAII